MNESDIISELQCLHELAEAIPDNLTLDGSIVKDDMLTGIHELATDLSLNTSIRWPRSSTTASLKVIDVTSLNDIQGTVNTLMAQLESVGTQEA